MQEAAFYKKLDNNLLQCLLCNHHCRINDGKRGICGVRENREGILYALNYGKVIARHLDPIEKKPFFHFLPGTKAYSISTVGCNFGCKFCQNYDISQYPKNSGEIIGEELTPAQIVQEALETNSASIAYTYTEPTIFYEFAWDIMQLAKEKGLKNIWVSNGFTDKKVLMKMKGYLDANNVDLKAFTEDFYQKYCLAKLQPIRENLILLKKLGVWVEVTTLIIPGLNDSEEELQGMARFIAQKLGTETPWHVSAFYPCYKMMDRPRTPPETLIKAREIG